MGPTIRTILPGDWGTLARMRDVLLADAPGAFDPGSTPTMSWDGGQWRRWCMLLADGEVEAGWCIDGAEVFDALVVCALDSHPAGVSVGWGWLWVAPHLRRQGLAAELVARVHGWALTNDADVCWMWVAEGNAAARHLYGRLGYRPTGVWSAPAGAGYREERWELEL